MPAAITELRPRLWRWELPHPEWTPEEAADGGWDEVVASYALVGRGDDFLLIDPLVPEAADADGFWTTLDRQAEQHGPPAVLVTIFWHARSARRILARYAGASVWAHEPAAELVAERTPVGETFRVGQTLPGGAVAYDAGRALEVVFWLPSHHAVAVGDVLLGDAPAAARLCPASWLGGGKTQADVRSVLQPLLELPVELVLLTHGDAIEADARGALARALAGA
jgi:glyoxylase-like metal-dependent hydrolase (beta-lactamase superfamily II)